MLSPSQVFHKAHRQTHPKMTILKRTKTKQRRSHSYLRRRSGMSITVRHKLTQTTYKKANFKEPIPLTPYLKKMQTRSMVPASLSLRRTSRTVTKTQKLARHQLSAKSLRIQRAEKHTKTLRRIIQTSLTTTTTVMNPLKSLHMKPSTSQYYRRYLTHLRILKIHPRRTLWAKIRQKHQ